MAQQHGMSQIIELRYNSAEDVEFLTDHIESISASFRILLEPNEDSKMFGQRQITEFSEELFIKMAWVIKDSTFPFSLLMENSEDITEHANTEKVNMNRECLFIDERRFGIQVKIWKFERVRFQGSIDEVLTAIEAVKATLINAFAVILPNYIVGFGGTIMENMSAGFPYSRPVSETQLEAVVRDFSGRNPQFKQKSILNEVDSSYILTYEVVTKKIDQSSKNSIKVPRITIGLNRCQVEGALPIDKFLELHKDLQNSFQRVCGHM